MATLISKLRSDVKHKIDFSLVPVGVILIEFSVLATQLSKDSYKSLVYLLLLRFLHTLLMLALAALISRIFIRLRITETNYRTIALTGTVTIAIGDVIHRYLGHKLGVQLVSADRRVGIVLLQGCFWFPAFMIIGSKRTEIFQQFRDYEKRIIVATRAQSRISKEFISRQTQIQDQIKQELFDVCNKLKASITAVWNHSNDISENNALIQPFLMGHELRNLSMKLEEYGSESHGSKFFGQNLNSVNLLIKQFRILYSTTAKNAPLRKSTYALVLIALVTPPYINYFSLKETLVAYPLMSLSIFIAGHFIAKSLASQSPRAIRNSSVLIYLAGFLPIIANIIGQAITQDPNTKYPILISSIILPFSYYFFIKTLQVLNPYALHLIRNDELKAGNSLQDAITKIVSEEFSHALSHRWAIYIHGNVLTRLAATALKLETSSNHQDSEAFNASVESLLQLLENPAAKFEQDLTDVRTEIASRLDPWNGLLEVTLHIDSEIESIRNVRVHELGEVIEELVSNSMRHGKSKEIDLRVTSSGDKNIKIVAIDDASIAPPLIQTRYGLGTRIFNLASDGRWKLERVESNTVFTLVMAIRL